MKHETVFEISIVDPEPIEEKKEKLQQAAPAPEPPKPEPKEEVVEEASQTPKIGADFKELFSEVEAKKPVKKIPLNLSTHDSAARRKKSSETRSKPKPENQAATIADSVKMKQTVAFAVTSTGEYDAYYAEITEILTSHWNPLDYPPGETASVIVTITSQGQFSYRIKRNFGMSEYDSDFIQFLERMKMTPFPPYTEGERVNVEVLFTTKKGSIQ